MYTEKVYGVEPLGTPAAQDLSSAGVHSYSKLFLSQIKLSRLAALVTTAVVSTGDVVIKFYDRPTPGSATGQVLVGTLNVPAAATVGSVYYKDVAQYSVAPGHQLVFDVTTAAAGAGAAGGAVYLVEGENDPEYVANQSSMIASS